MRMDFGASTFQAPPPPPPQEDHQQVGMDSARSPQQHHDYDDEDNHDWLDEEHLGDESQHPAGRWRRPSAGFVV
ncbi:hypothetical protein Scep_006983 [Stephania cephalantha]|uniref:Uncharacterized protein n=1 Tax=Stephania cephalantha TaxID=152367 RepID=A0AAP0PPK3_9MAGN